MQGTLQGTIVVHYSYRIFQNNHLMIFYDNKGTFQLIRKCNQVLRFKNKVKRKW